MQQDGKTFGGSEVGAVARPDSTETTPQEGCLGLQPSDALLEYGDAP